MKPEAKRELDEILDRLSVKQIHWVTARVIVDTDKAASKLVGVHPKTPYLSTDWKDIKQDMNRAVEIIQRDHAIMALMSLDRMLPKALHALEKILDSRNVPIAAVKMFIDRYVPEIQQHKLDADLSVFDLEDWKATRKARLTEVANASDETEDG